MLGLPCDPASDPAAPALDHRPGQQLREQQRTPHIHRRDLRQLLCCLVFEPTDGSVRGVIDHQPDGCREPVDREPVDLDPLELPPHAVEVGHICGEGDHVDVVGLAQASRGRGKAVFVAGEQHEVDAELGDRFGEGGAQSVGPAGDQGVRAVLLVESRGVHRAEPIAR
jgi:hypothetical protein